MEQHAYDAMRDRSQMQTKVLARYVQKVTLGSTAHAMRVATGKCTMMIEQAAHHAQKAQLEQTAYVWPVIQGSSQHPTG